MVGEDQKIWFVYLTDHHEGPFTVADVAAKHSQGLVDGKTLSWKDGMAEWVPLETIPELATILSASSAAALSVESPDDGASLAQMLASNQQAEAAPDLSVEDIAVDGEDSSAAPVSATLPKAFTKPAATKSSVQAATFDQPADDEQVWNLRNSGSVSGPFSMEQLAEMAKAGELEEDFELWAPGMTDFQSGKQFPSLAKQKKSAGGGLKSTLNTLTKGLNKAAGAASKKTGLPKTVNPAADDEVTDPGIEMPAKNGGVLAKLKNLFAKKAAKKAAPAAFKGVATTKKITKASSSGGAGAMVKRLVMVLVVVGLLGGAGSAYFMFFMSSIPNMEDVRPGDFEQIKAVAKESLKAGAKTFLAISQADDINPTYYFASNLPEGTVVSMLATGAPGTLVNAVGFEKKLTAPVMKTHIATFGPLENEGKPFPMGEYTLEITADNGVKLEQKVFIGGKRTGPTYERRMKQYKDKLQASYDQEIQELRELIQTLKSTHDDLVKKVGEYKGNRSLASWRGFANNFVAITGQLDQKLKDKVAALATAEKYYPGTYKDIQTMLGQLVQYFQLENAQVETGKVQNTAELHALTQAGIQSLDQFLAQALVRSPLDVLAANYLLAHPADGAAPAAIAPSTAPATAPAVATPAPLVAAPNLSP